MKKARGFTLTEILIVVAIIGILSAIAIPSYRAYVVRASRQAAQTDLLQMAALQEKIYLNSSSYSITANIITDPYTGQATGGLGWQSTSKDRKYTYACPAASCVVTSGVANSFTITASPAPIAGNTQANDGTLSINSIGQRLWTGGSSLTW